MLLRYLQFFIIIIDYRAAAVLNFASHHGRRKKNVYGSHTEIKCWNQTGGLLCPLTIHWQMCSSAHIKSQRKQKKKRKKMQSYHLPGMKEPVSSTNDCYTWQPTINVLELRKPSFVSLENICLIVIRKIVGKELIMEHYIQIQSKTCLFYSILK